MPVKWNPTTQGAALILGGMLVVGFVDNFVRVIAIGVSVWQFHAMRSALIGTIIAFAPAPSAGTAGYAASAGWKRP